VSEGVSKAGSFFAKHTTRGQLKKAEASLSKSISILHADQHILSPEELERLATKYDELSWQKETIGHYGIVSSNYHAHKLADNAAAHCTDTLRSSDAAKRRQLCCRSNILPDRGQPLSPPVKDIELDHLTEFISAKNASSATDVEGKGKSVVREAVPSPAMDLNIGADQNPSSSNCAGLPHPPPPYHHSLTM